MKTRRKMVKRWIAGVLAVTMLSSTMSTAAFAAPESTDAPETVETARVTAWNWTDGSALTWQEDTSAWTLTLSEEQTISAEADLLALLPVSVEATLAQAETEATPAPDTAATPAPESTPDTEATEVTPTPVAEVDPAAEEGATAPAAAALAQPEEGATGADTLSVEPQNDEEATPAPETATPAPTAAPQPTESPAPTADAEPTEEPAAEADTETLTLTWDTAALIYPLAGGDYTVTAALPEGYALDEAAPALAVVVKVPGAEEEDTPAADNSLSDSASAPSMLAEDPPYIAGDEVQTVSPVGTTINLFDYTIREGVSDKDFQNPFYAVLYSNYGDLGSGINKGHYLKFSKGGVHIPVVGWHTGYGNTYNGSDDDTHSDTFLNRPATPVTGIVQPTLDIDGFPVLSNNVNDSWVPNVELYGTDADCTPNESLAYLFSTSEDDTNPAGSREIYANVKGLLKMEDGYYTFDSDKEYARYDQTSNSFTVNSEPRYGFFPFDDAEGLKKDTNENRDILGNHYFGMTMTTRFVQQNGGLSTKDNNTPITYEFTGDDDVWVFIDNVLVGDLGGLHNAASLKIDFSSGKVIINDEVQNGERSETTLRKMFETAKCDAKWSDTSPDTFADNTYHTLRFFYLERGNNTSNLKLKFNMESTSESSIYNVDQDGIGISGSSFQLLPARYDSTSNTYEKINDTPLFSGTTDADGYLVFEDENGNKLKLSDLKEQVKIVGGNAVVVHEDSVPAGYRSHEDSVLYFYGGDQDILLSADPWSQGTYASPMVTTTLTNANSIQVEQNLEAPDVKPSTDSGTFFAVVLKKSSGGQWLPVYGDPINGWHVESNASWASVLSAAKANKYVFAADNNGPRVTVENLPGDISKYFYMVKKNNPHWEDAAAEAQSEYTVAYYYTSAGKLDDATSKNTVRLNTDDLNSTDITREFSVRVYVSNTKNYLIAQAVGPDGSTPINDVTYSLYDSTQVDETGNLKENALACDFAQTRTMDQAKNDPITAGGVALFPTAGHTLSAGTYYLKETAGPNGYQLNDHLIKVVVNNTGVYAYAGEDDLDNKDGVTVLRGAGKIVRSMLQVAVPDAINTTLTDITATLDTLKDGSPEPTKDTQDVNIWESTGKTTNLSYHTSTAVLEYGPSDTNNGDYLYFEVTSGWSHVSITQNYNNNNLVSPPDASFTYGDKEELLDKDDNPLDLTNLFSRSTIVRVANTEKTYSLTINKTVAEPLMGADSDAEFKVNVKLTKDGADLAGTFPYYYSTNADNKIGEWTSSNPDLTLTHGQTIIIPDIPYGTSFTVTEPAEGNAINYTARYEVEPADDGTSEGETGTPPSGEVSEPSATEATGVLEGDRTVNITNTRKAGSVAVSNTVDGAMGSYSDTFTYTLKLYDKTADNGNLTIDGTYDATLRTAGQAEQSVKITFEGGVATTMTPVVEGAETPQAQDIKLAHGDTLTIEKLPAGATVEATETDAHNGYTVKVGSATTRVGTVTVPNNDTDKPTIAFTNTREAIVPTGMREENNPYIVMIGLAGMAALVGAAGWVEMRRRKRREEE